MIEFVVYGHPEPQGSTRAFIPKGWKRAIITTDNPKMKPWRQQVAGVAFDLLAGDPLPYPTGVPVCLHLHFYLAKPVSAPKKRWALTVKPDLSKLVRAVEDSLTGILFNDDAQIVRVDALKQYGLPERVEIKLEPVTPTDANCTAPRGVIRALTDTKKSTTGELFTSAGRQLAGRP